MANGHHLWDNEQGLETYHLHLESLVCFFFLFLFFFFIYIFNLPRYIHHNQYHPQQQELEMNHVSSPGKIF